MPARDGSSIYVSESVAEGHPDKVADYIADSVLDAALRVNPGVRVACEVLCKHDQVVLAGETGLSDAERPGLENVVRRALLEIGYTSGPFSADNVIVEDELLMGQSREIGNAVDHAADSADEVGAGDQGMMYGYATTETPELMPLPILLAHRITGALARARKQEGLDWLMPDAKCQVAIAYRDGRPTEVRKVLVSSQHAPGSLDDLRSFVREKLLPAALGDWWNAALPVDVNPAGKWTIGGPVADAGVTGRKIIADTYGGLAHHGGGAFSGKDATKVDRSAAYFCRYVARQAVLAGLCERLEVRVAYTIGLAEPFAVGVETFGTGEPAAVEDFVSRFDFRPGAIIRQLGLNRPIYRQTTNYGHFGREGLPWEM
jgi:S-adenosylmethionine synthetase